MSTKGFLQDAKNQQKRLAETITAKGITASATEKYTDLVDKVAQIENLKGEERTLENFTGNILSEPKNNVQLNFPEANKTITAQLGSKNIIPYPYADGESKTFNGITWIVSSDGTIHVSGTATADSFFKVATITPEFSGQYRFTGTAPGGSISRYYSYIYNETDKKRMFADYGTITGGLISSLDSNKTYSIYITVVKNTSLTNAKSFKLQLTYGNTLPTYTNYISDFSTISVLACGKNLSPVNTWTSNASFTLFTRDHGSYTLSAKITRATTATSGSPNMMLRVLHIDQTKDEKYESISINNGQPKQYNTTITTNPNKTINQIQIIPLNSSVGNLKAENIQVEFGTQATDYEPYQGQTYIPTSSGLVTGITSLSPITTLVTNNAGAVFTSVTGETYKEITPSTGKNAITKVYQPAVTNNIDSNIASENIKKDVSILGVTGDYICNYTYDETTKELVLIL